MGTRVLDPRLASLAEDAEEGVVTGQVAVILSELHLTIQAKRSRSNKYVSSTNCVLWLLDIGVNSDFASNK